MPQTKKQKARKRAYQRDYMRKYRRERIFVPVLRTKVEKKAA